MGKQSKSKKENAAAAAGGAGLVTPTQVAFIVDRYLSDNNFLTTLSAFRSEASSLLPPTIAANQSAKSLLKLSDMLDGYIRLKAEKIHLDNEKTRLEHEKSRVNNLLRGMQHVMNAYNGAAALAPPSSNPIPPPVYNKSLVIGPSNPISQQKQPTAQLSSLKRRIINSKNNAPTTTAPPSKRSRTKCASSATTKPPVLYHPLPPPPLPTNNITPLPSSSVVKCLFNSSPQTPSPSSTDNKKKLAPSPQTTQQQQHTTSTNCTVITSETIQVSPTKQVSYYSIERNHHCISSPLKKRFTTNRDHVKGRLDFDAAASSSDNILHSNSVDNSPSQDDEFDFDLPNLDCFGADFSFSDLLGDFDLDGFCPAAADNVGSSPDCLSGSPDKLVDGSTGDHQLLSGMSSTFTEIQSEQDMNNLSGPNSVTSVKSVTKCIKVFSPVKSSRSKGSSDQEIVDADVVA